MAILIFHPTAYLAVFGVVVTIWIASEVVGGIIVPSRRREGGPVQQRQKRLNVLGLLGYDAVIVSSVLLAAFGVTILPNWAYFVGIALILLGVSVRQWAIAVLGRYFSHVIGIQHDQKVVQSGPYRLVRHPSYTGILLILIGIAFVFQTWAGVLVALTAFGLAWGYRMLVEERFLARELGDSYAEYARRTKRLLPFLI
jgi:protein-S-isoprenylcysteine O-methyltransferase Ste14